MDGETVRKFCNNSNVPVSVIEYCCKPASILDQSITLVVQLPR